MNTLSNEFVTVHMRGLKAPLMARAQAQRISVSVLVRAAIERELAQSEPSTTSEGALDFGASAAPIVKLSIRLPVGEAEQLKAGARQAGLSRGAFIVGLLGRVPLLAGDGDGRLDCLAALTASCAELATLGRSVSHLTALLRHGEVQAAQEYRRLLDTLADDVRMHLHLAATVLAQLRPARRSGGSSRPDKLRAA